MNGSSLDKEERRRMESIQMVNSFYSKQQTSSSFFLPSHTTVSHDLRQLLRRTSTQQRPCYLRKQKLFPSSTLASSRSVLFYFILISFISSMANPWILYRIGAREWPSTLSTQPVNEGKLLLFIENQMTERGPAESGRCARAAGRKRKVDESLNRLHVLPFTVLEAYCNFKRPSNQFTGLY